MSSSTATTSTFRASPFPPCHGCMHGTVHPTAIRPQQGPQLTATRCLGKLGHYCDLLKQPKNISVDFSLCSLRSRRKNKVDVSYGGMGGIVLCRGHFGTSVPTSYGSRSTSGGARAENLVGNPLAALIGATMPPSRLVPTDLQEWGRGLHTRLLHGPRVRHTLLIGKVHTHHLQYSGMCGEGH